MSKTYPIIAVSVLSVLLSVPAEARCRRPATDSILPPLQKESEVTAAPAFTPITAKAEAIPPESAALPPSPAEPEKKPPAKGRKARAAQAGQPLDEHLRSDPSAILPSKAAIEAPALQAEPQLAALAPVHHVSPSESLRTALTRWTAGSGWELVWDAPNDYSISAAADFPGDIQQAVTQLMETLRGNGAPFGAEIWKGNRVIRVTRFR